ncbi:hypothetical protein Ancab_015414 [Ancistrocladus abbreviatus]
MEKSEGQKNEQKEPKLSELKPKALVWDCGSTLYDSFELNSFKKQLDSAISSRTLSMPHLTDHRRQDPLPPPPPPSSSKKQTLKLPRSFQKLLKSVFKSVTHNSTSWFHHHDHPENGGKKQKGERIFLVYEKSGELSAIPEGPEFDYKAGFSPEISSLVRRTTSDRFTAASAAGVSCA